MSLVGSTCLRRPECVINWAIQSSSLQTHHLFHSGYHGGIGTMMTKSKCVARFIAPETMVCLILVRRLPTESRRSIRLKRCHNNTSVVLGDTDQVSDSDTASTAIC